MRFLLRVEANETNPTPDARGADGIPGDRLRLLDLARGDLWPAREASELALVLDCDAGGVAMPALDGHLHAGDLVLLPPDDGGHTTGRGRVLAARLRRLTASPAPQRFADGLIAGLMRRTWASASTAPEVVGPCLRLVEILTEHRVRAHRAHFDAREMLDPRIAQAIDHIEAHLGEALSVAEVAAAACLSSSQFARSFKAATGAPVWAFVQRRRCERARHMLLNTRLPVVEIAFRCGFSSQSHLTRAFRARFRTTPGHVRRTGD